MWNYEFYRDDEGNEPVKDFLLTLDKKARAKVMAFIQILSEYGPTLHYPYSSQVEGKIRELRPRFGKTAYRIMYYQDRNRVFILLHGFIKKTGKTPKNEIDIARLRMKDDDQRKKRKKGGDFSAKKN